MGIKGLSAHFDWFLFILEDRCIDDLMTDDNLLFHHIKQIDFMLPWVCSIIDHKGWQNEARKSVAPSAAPSMPSFFFLTSSVILLLLNRESICKTINPIYSLHLSKEAMEMDGNAGHLTQGRQLHILLFLRMLRAN